MKQKSSNEPKSNVAQGTGLDFSEERINDVEDMYDDIEDDSDEDWEPYEEDGL